MKKVQQIKREGRLVLIYIYDNEFEDEIEFSDTFEGYQITVGFQIEYVFE